jgi:hypothetical protein
MLWTWGLNLFSISAININYTKSPEYEPNSFQ